MGSGIGSNIEFRARIHSLQKTMLIIQLVLIAIGGCLFGISVEVRPILRLASDLEFRNQVGSFCDLMLFSGIFEIFIGGFNCLSTCWKLNWPVYIAIGLCIILILVQVSAIVSVFYLMSEGVDLVSEHIYFAWYQWECQAFGSCRNAFINYIYKFMLPQVCLLAVAIAIQIYAVITLVRFINSINQNRLRIWTSRNLLHHPESVSSFNQIERSKIKSHRFTRESSVDSIDFIEKLLSKRKDSEVEGIINDNDSDINNNNFDDKIATAPAGGGAGITKAQIHCFEISEGGEGQIVDQISTSSPSFYCVPSEIGTGDQGKASPQPKATPATTTTTAASPAGSSYRSPSYVVETTFLGLKGKIQGFPSVEENSDSESDGEREDGSSQLN